LFAHKMRLPGPEKTRQRNQSPKHQVIYNRNGVYQTNISITNYQNSM